MPKECPLCNGWWTVLDPETKTYIWCNCRTAQEMRRETPDWCQFVNRYPGKGNTPLELLAAGVKRVVKK